MALDYEDDFFRPTLDHVWIFPRAARLWRCGTRALRQSSNEVFRGQFWPGACIDGEQNRVHPFTTTACAVENRNWIRATVPRRFWDPTGLQTNGGQR